MSKHEGKLHISTSYQSDDIAALDRLPAELDRAMLRATIDAADDLHDAIRARIPRSEGSEAGPHAQDSWRRRIVPYSNGALVILFTEDAIAYYYWSGTKAHPIVARFAKALHFFVNGQELFRKRVNHPGTRPHPYVEEAGRAVLPIARQRYEDAVSRALSG